MKSPDLIQRFEREGATPVTSSPEQLHTFIASEIVKWGKVVDRTPMSTN
jgi:tripartite-type tricarboxylate transporter receptor subunit TctC